MRAADFAATGGDSGGTVYGFVLFSFSVPLAGIISADACGHIQYTYHSNARINLDLHGWVLN